MKINRLYKKKDMDGLTKELNEIIIGYEIIGEKKYPIIGKVKQEKWNWSLCGSDREIIVFLYNKEYEKDFIKICEKYDVDELNIYEKNKEIK